MTIDFIEIKKAEGLLPLKYDKHLIYVAIDASTEVKKEAFKMLIEKSLQEVCQSQKELAIKMADWDMLHEVKKAKELEELQTKVKDNQ